jgi:hypothetical protein
MKAGYWKDIVEIIGIGAIVASLVFVGLQLQQEQEIAIVDTYVTVSEAGMNLSMQVGENMEIWQKALEGHELTTEEYGVFIGLFNAVMIHYNQNFIRFLRVGPFNPDGVASDFAYALYIFPGMKSAFEEITKNRRAREEARHMGQRQGQFESAVLSSLAKFEEEKPPVPDTKLYVFWSF